MKLNILHNKLVLDYKLYILLHIENKTGMSHLKFDKYGL